jgi:hypothetical protein
VLSFATYHYLKDKSNVDSHAINLMAIALAYHDLGLWVTVDEGTATNDGIGTLDYLDPSVKLFLYDQKQLAKTNPPQENKESKTTVTSIIPILSDYEIEIVTEIIVQHHKLTPWNWKNTNASITYDDTSIKYMELLVNAIRCADWADATMGIVRFNGLSIQFMDYLYRRVPESGFHETLLILTSRLSPLSYLQRLHILRILKW